MKCLNYPRNVTTSLFSDAFCTITAKGRISGCQWCAAALSLNWDNRPWWIVMRCLNDEWSRTFFSCICWFWVFLVTITDHQQWSTTVKWSWLERSFALNNGTHTAQVSHDEILHNSPLRIFWCSFTSAGTFKWGRSRTWANIAVRQPPPGEQLVTGQCSWGRFAVLEPDCWPWVNAMGQQASP